ncbi:MAG TPA: signal peptidase I [Polyangiaceae bacterium]|nr:signal peptidase I [Polyangiaceae bacterium]
MGRFLNGLFWIGLLLAVIVGAARLVAIRWWQVPMDDPILEASIAPTLRGGDWVLLWRVSPPKFGALTVCPDPTDESRVVIGRILGEEGDTVTVEGTRLTIDEHEALTETACPPFKIADPTTGSEIEQTCDMEAAGGTLHMRGNMPAQRQALALRTSRKVGEKKVFLLSDNRAYPYDSRNFGSVDRSSCKETIFFRLVSKAGFGDEAARLTYIR